MFESPQHGDFDSFHSIDEGPRHVLEIACPGCGKSYQLSEQLRGKGARCKDCQTVFPIPAAKTNAPRVQQLPHSSRLDRPKPLNAAQRVQHLQQVLEALGEFPKPKMTIAHRLVALLVTIVMLSLPLFYIGFVVGIGWLTYWHITHDYIWMQHTRGRAAIFAFFLYAGLAVGGVVWVFSLIKPFFMRLRGSDREEGLSRSAEPVLYSFSHLLADKVGSPRPDTICLSLDVNASASYNTKWFGLGRKEFTLTLGIPLVAGLTLPQLAGIIAHEFGHFSQRGSTLLQRLIWRINLWFIAAVYRHDAIDDLIESLTNSTEGGMLPVMIGFMLYLLVGLGRMVMWCLMQVGQLVSAALLQRMEYDADRYEIGLVGSEVFEQAARRVITLTVAQEVALKQVFGSLRGDHLPRDFAAFVTGLADDSEKLQKRANKLIKNEKPELFGTHPTTRDRIKAAKKMNQPGAFESDLPASALFVNFHSRCENLSNMLYDIRFGPTFTRDTMRSTSEALGIYFETMGRK